MDDLTKEERAEAARQNWGLFHVFDADKQRWIRTVLPTPLIDGCRAGDALNQVIAQAKFNHSLSIKALRLMAQFNAGPEK